MTLPTWPPTFGPTLTRSTLTAQQLHPGHDADACQDPLNCTAAAGVRLTQALGLAGAHPPTARWALVTPGGQDLGWDEVGELNLATLAANLQHADRVLPLSDVRAEWDGHQVRLTVDDLEPLLCVPGDDDANALAARWADAAGNLWTGTLGCCLRDPARARIVVRTAEASLRLRGRALRGSHHLWTALGVLSPAELAAFDVDLAAALAATLEPGADLVTAALAVTAA